MGWLSGNLAHKWVGIWTVALLAGGARAQLPDVDIPDTVPSPVGVPGVLTPGGDLVNGVTGAADRTMRRLASARLARVEVMSREHRAELDRDPAGELVVRAEVVAVDITDAALQRALEKHFLLARTQELPDLGVKISVLRKAGTRGAGSRSCASSIPPAPMTTTTSISTAAAPGSPHPR